MLKKISVVIPCYNEENTIITVLNNVYKSLESFSNNFEVIVVDDCSTDNTLNKIEEFKKKLIIIKHDQNLGKGSALQSGFEKVSGELVIVQDADLEYNPNEYSKILLPFYETDADVVYGSRFIGGGKYVRIHFFWHYLANKILTFLSNIITNLNLTDMETGFKVFKSEKLKQIILKEKSFGIEPELTIKLSKIGSKFYEVPISYNGRGYNEGKKIGMKDAFIAVYCIFKYGLFN